jgi:hypothetical protein
MRFSEDVPRKRKGQTYTPRSPLNPYGTITNALVFCAFPKTFTVRTNGGEKRITYWLETIGVEAKYTKGSYGDFWKTTKVNGLDVVYTSFHLPR